MSKDYEYYRVYDHDDHLEPGHELRIQHRVEFIDWSWERDHLAGLTDQPEQALAAMRTESAEKEQEIYETLRSAFSRWEKQASRTMLLDKALEYVRNPEVEHTGNQWTEKEPGCWEISNRVYKMIYTIAQDAAGGVWRVSWSVDYNPPPQPESRFYHGWGSSANIAEQRNKRYPSLEAAQRYIQSRFDLYAHLFLEVNPPVPVKERRMFTVNTHLLPGYILEPSGPNREAVDTLLACLEDDDTAGLGQPSSDAPSAPKEEPVPTPPGEQVPATPLEQAKTQRLLSHQKKQRAAPVKRPAPTR